MSKKNRIILIGNGFDLQIGLRTTYKDFFAWQEQILFKNATIKIACADKNNFVSKLENYWKEDITEYPYLTTTNLNENRLIQSNNINDFEYVTIWDVYFISNLNSSNICWFDVENSIYESFKILNNSFFWQNVVLIIVETINKKYDSYGAFCNDVNGYKNEEKYTAYFIKKFRPLILNVLYDKCTNKINFETLLDFLKKELLFFELKFSIFISKFSGWNLNNKWFGYKDDSLKLLNQILNYDISKNPDPLYLISFNYTIYPNLLLGWNDDRAMAVEQQSANCFYIPKSYRLNLHGCADEMNIIFGIDDHTFKNEKDSLWELSFNFTKSFRLNVIKQRKELKKFNLPANEDNEIEIYFYGLSLARNDYSYYQSLFDKYNLYYNNNVKLIFVTTKKHEIELKHNVYLLIQEYGKTLDNKDHGKNLMTLLQLENRLLYTILPEYKNF